MGIQKQRGTGIIHPLVFTLLAVQRCCCTGCIDDDVFVLPILYSRSSTAVQQCTAVVLVLRICVILQKQQLGSSAGTAVLHLQERYHTAVTYRYKYQILI